MESLVLKYRKKVDAVPTAFVRDFMDVVDWRNRFVGIKGARGVGKTTFLLQYAKLRIPESEKSLYASLDDLYFKKHRLYEFAEQFVRSGGSYLLLDEVHRYADWSQELKNMYDDFPQLRVIFTGSSVIHLAKSKADLSRRAVMYQMYGLSFREFLQLAKGFAFPAITLSDLLQQHSSIALEIDRNLKPLQYFQDYLRFGYHPFFLENVDAYSQKLIETINLMLEIDFPSAYGMTYATVDKIKTFLVVLAESVPFKPNVQKLSEQTGLTRNMLTEQMHNLEDAGVLHLLHRHTKGITRLQKPDKVFLANTNLSYALDNPNPDVGTLRETFFVSQVRPNYTVEYSEEGDFWVNNQFTVEVGGRKKGFPQMQNVTTDFVAADGLDIGSERKIPLWLFGFLY
ncbi:MAG: AAA family ATPase [Saprospiraceae bacterium]